MVRQYFCSGGLDVEIAPPHFSATPWLFSLKRCTHLNIMNETDAVIFN